MPPPKALSSYPKEKRSFLNGLTQRCSGSAATCTETGRRKIHWQDACGDDELVRWVVNALRMRLGMRIKQGKAQLRTMKKAVIFRIFAACVFTLSILAFFQLGLDDTISKVRRKHHPVQDQFADDKDGHIIYNVCSAPNLKVLRREMGYLSSPYRVFPEPIDHTESCSSSSSKKFLQKSLPPVCRKLFTAQPLNGLEERWIKDTNKQLAAKEIEEEELLQNSMDCEWLRSKLSSNFYISAKERSFPIAYAINVDRAPSQILEFLSVIYRPHNLHCLHCDQKSSPRVKAIINNIASCFGNIIIPRKIESVNWGWHTIQDAYFNCFSDLTIARDMYPWRYIITLCGMEVPLRTNAEIVALLEPLNGTSSVQTVGHDGIDDFKFKWKWTLNKLTGWVTKRDDALPPIPYSLKVYKSWAYLALSYRFVQFLLCNPEAITFRNFMKDVRIPEENTFATLFMRPNTPGGYRPEHKTNIFPVTNLFWLDGGGKNGFFTKLYLGFFPGPLCAGTIRHGICLVEAMDLYRLSYKPGILPLNEPDLNSNPNMGREYEGKDRGPLFQNKFSMARDRVVMECMQQELAHRNALELRTKCT